MKITRLLAGVAVAAALAGSTTSATAEQVHRYSGYECNGYQLGSVQGVLRCPVVNSFPDGLYDVTKAYVDFTTNVPTAQYMCTWDSGGVLDVRPLAKACIVYSNTATGAFGSSCFPSPDSEYGGIAADAFPAGPTEVELAAYPLEVVDYLKPWHDHPHGYPYLYVHTGGQYGSGAWHCGTPYPQPAVFRGYRVHADI